MSTLLTAILIPVAVGLIMLLINKLTFKSSADMIRDIGLIKDDVKNIREQAWTTEQKIQLEQRLTRFESKLESLLAEVDFTKTSHQEFLRLLEKALIPVAHSPHTPELDQLLEKRERGEELTGDEWQALIDRLGEQAKEYDRDPTLAGKKVSLLGLRAIYRTYLRQARRLEQRSQQLVSGEQ